MSNTAEPTPTTPHTDAKPSEKLTEVKYEHTPGFVNLLDSLGISLLVTTYQAGKLFTLGTSRGAIAIGFYNFEQAMGVAVKPGRIAVGARRQIWYLRSAPDIAAKVDPPGKYDACYLTRSAHFTGMIHGHELAWAGDELWVVNTLFSCLCTVHEDFSFVPRWHPPFITSLAAEDRCHLNGLAMADGRPRYVTACSQSDVSDGWRDRRHDGGCVIDVASGAIVAAGLSMPHSPRLYRDRLWLINSGDGHFGYIDVPSGRFERVAFCPGYGRGLAFVGDFAVVGLSRPREQSFQGLALDDELRKRGAVARCGLQVIDLRTGNVAHWLRLEGGLVQELYDVVVLPGVVRPKALGFQTNEIEHQVWFEDEGKVTGWSAGSR